MKIIYLKDCHIKSEKDELIAISKIKFNGLSIVDIIRDKFSSKYKIKFLSTSEKDLTSLITSNENILVWPLNLYPKNIENLESIFKKISLSIYNVKIYPDQNQNFINKSKLQNKDNLLDKSLFFKYSTNQIDTSYLIIYSEDLIYCNNLRTYKNLRSYNPTSRSFNSLLLTKDNWYEKKSFDIEKLHREYSFIKNLPLSLKNFFPKLSKTGIKNYPKQISYSIKNIPGEDLASILLQNKVTEELSNNLFDFLYKWLISVGKEQLNEGNFHAFIRKKCLDRFQKFKNLEISNEISSICKFYSIPDPNSQLHKLLFLLDETKNEINKYYLGFFHGDLCLSNIVHYDKTFYLIDPRGFDKNNSKTNILYEFAKLRHSIISNYDYINTNQSSIEFLGQKKFKINIHNKNSDNFLEKLYFDLLEAFSISDDLIKLIESTLFFSMIPLHSENKDKMLTFYLTSIKSIDEIS